MQQHNDFTTQPTGFPLSLVARQRGLGGVAALVLRATPPKIEANNGTNASTHPHQQRRLEGVVMVPDRGRRADRSMECYQVKFWSNTRRM